MADVEKKIDRILVSVWLRRSKDVVAHIFDPEKGRSACGLSADVDDLREPYPCGQRVTFCLRCGEALDDDFEERVSDLERLNEELFVNERTKK